MNIETIKDKEVKIRKERQCYSCLRKFPSGTIMRNWVGNYEGDFNSVYSCSTCDAIMRLCPSDGEGYPERFVFEMLDRGQTVENKLHELELKK